LAIFVDIILLQSDGQTESRRYPLSHIAKLRCGNSIGAGLRGDNHRKYTRSDVMRSSAGFSETNFTRIQDIDTAPTSTHRPKHIVDDMTQFVARWL